MGWRPLSCINRHPKNQIQYVASVGQGIYKIVNFMTPHHKFMMKKKASIKIVNCMTPGVGVLVLRQCRTSHTVKMHYFFKNLLFSSQAQIRQNECIVMMTKEGSIKILNFMTFWAGVLVLGSGHIKSYSENALFLLKSFSQLLEKCIVMMTQEQANKYKVMSKEASHFSNFMLINRHWLICEY